MGKLRKLRKAIEANPEIWCERYVWLNPKDNRQYVASDPLTAAVKRKKKSLQIRPVYSRTKKPYRSYVAHVLRSLGHIVVK